MKTNRAGLPDTPSMGKRGPAFGLALLAAVVLLQSFDGGRRGRRSGSTAERDGEPFFAPGLAPSASAGTNEAWRRWAAEHRVTPDAGEALWTGAWKELGPRNIAGRVNAVVFPDPTRPRSILAGTAGGGLFASEDFGASWRRLGGDNLPSLWIGAIGVDPSNPSVFYAGTGDGNISFPGIGRMSSSGVGVAGGILKTIDGGASLSFLPIPGAGAFFRIVVSRGDSRIVVAAATDGIYRTGDGGASWEKTDATQTPTDLLEDPAVPARFLAVSGRIKGGNGGLFESRDTGETWSPIGSGLPPPDDWGRPALALADAPARRLYLWISDTSSLPQRRLYRSSDDGASWTDVTPSMISQRGGSGGYGAHLVAFSSASGQALLLHDGFTMYAVRASGAVGSADPWAIPGGFWHLDTHGADVSADGNSWIAATDGGVAVSDDGGATFRRADQGFPNVQFYSCALAPGDRSTVYGGTQDNSMAIDRGSADGSFESSYPPRLGDVGEISVDFDDPGEVTVATSHAFSVGVSDDSGRTWRDTTANGIAPQDFVTTSRTALVRSPLDAKRLYLGTHGVYVSDDGGVSWTPRTPRGTVPGGIAALAAGRDDSVWSSWSDGRVFVSSDGGDTWADRSPAISVVSPGTGISAGQAAGSAWASFSGNAGPRILRTRDGGASWDDVSGDLAAGAVLGVVADPEAPNRVFVGMEHGAVVSEDGGDHWQPLGGGLPNAMVADICVSPIRIVAATYGRGMWSFDRMLPRTAVSVRPVSPPGSARVRKP
jgi:photosystem II stability/assembly factor-like uncharacterized protein